MNWTCEVKMKMDKESRYSVLMSVYGRERPEYLRAALKSIMGQTLAADEIVLVCLVMEICRKFKRCFLTKSVSK